MKKEKVFKPVFLVNIFKYCVKRLLLGSLFSFSAIPKFEILMFTASELLDKINSHIADLQFERTPKGLYDPVASGWPRFHQCPDGALSQTI